MVKVSWWWIEEWLIVLEREFLLSGISVKRRPRIVVGSRNKLFLVFSYFVRLKVLSPYFTLEKRAY